MSNTPVDYSARLLQDLEDMKITELNAVNIFSVCFNLMSSVEKFKELKGAEKKELVIKVIRIFGEKVNAPSFLIDGLDGFIDIAVSINRGDLNIKAVSKSLCACFPCFS